MAAASKQPKRFLLTGQVARRLNRSPETVRLLERQGRLRAIKTETGVRLFDADDVEREAQRRERDERLAAHAEPPRLAV
jgi:DNA-binding transcriptional MerR regulator